MDGFSAGMVARGPTFAPDRASWTGSLHILDLPSADAVRDFVEHEPYNRAGLFRSHVVRRFRNLLGRTMWEFADASGDPRFVVLAHGGALDVVALPPERLIVHGELRTLEEDAPAGFVLALEAPTRASVQALLASDLTVEILDWEFGGRR